MKKKSYYLFGLIFTIFIVFISLTLFLNTFHAITDTQLKNKNMFVKMTTLPDLALSTQSSYIRHRSLSDVFSIYQNDGTLREYDITSFTYSPTYTYNSASSKVLNEK